MNDTNENPKSIDDLCTWKVVANNDVEKKRLHEIYRTLNRNQACFNCTGYDFLCECYFNNKGETKEDKKYDAKITKP